MDKQSIKAFVNNLITPLRNRITALAASSSAQVSQTITNGVTTKSPSEDAVFDALALKADLASPALTGNPTAPTQTEGNSTTRLATTAFVQGQGQGIKIYRALLTQAGTDAPTAVVLQNSLDEVPVWSRAAVGEYELTASGSIFTENKTLCFTTGGQPTVPNANGITSSCNRHIDTIVRLRTFDAAGVAADADMSGQMSLEILVYP